MWFIGLLVGAALGLGIDTDAVIPGALLGAVLGALLGLRSRSDRNRIEARFADLDAKSRFLYDRVLALEAKQARTGADPGAATTPPPEAALPGMEPADAPNLPPEPEIAPSAGAVGISTALPDESIASAPAATPRPPSLIWRRLFGGNLLAKAGVVLLFFGAASALKLAAENGMLPLPLRLAGLAAASLAMIVFGWRQRTRRAAFALALQGGGYALHYLIVYFMLARFHIISALPAFAAFAALGVACVLQAIRQDGRSLAVLGISGAFIAPVLASSHGGSHVMLFSYFALLNLFVFAVSWLKSWRAMNLTGMFLSLAIGTAWGLRSYTPAHFASTEPFLLLFFLLYSLIPLMFAMRGQQRPRGYVDSILVFGTPVLVGLLQAPMLEPFEYRLALWAAPAGLYYLALGAWLRSRRDDQLLLLTQAQYWLGATLLTLALPFFFGAQASVAAWAIEGAGAVWVGSRQGNRWVRLAGVALQGLAASYLVLHFDQLGHARPVFNDRFVDALLIAAAGLLSAAALRRRNDLEALLAPLLLAWGLAWWLGAVTVDIDDFLISALHPAAMITLVAATLGACEWAGSRLAWTPPRVAAALLSLPLLAFAFWQWDSHMHPAGNWGWLAWPLALAAHYLTLARHERDELLYAVAARHLVALWLGTILLTLEAAWQIGELAPLLPVLVTLAYGLVPTLVLAIVLQLTQHDALAKRSEIYLGSGSVALLAWLLAWSLQLNIEQSGSAGGWMYFPFANPLDFAQAAVLAVLLSWSDRHEQGWRGVIRCAIAALALVWLSAMVGRVLHHWAGLPFDWPRLLDSIALQASWSLLWSALALALMLPATRRGLRGQWFAGFGLLALVGLKLLLVDTAHVNTIGRTISLLGVAVLVIAVSYFSPTPPRNGEPQEAPPA